VLSSRTTSPVLSCICQGSKATRLIQLLCPSPKAICSRSATEYTVSRSSSPPVATYWPSGLQQQHSSPP
jgi:hypothetical protein